MRDIDLIEFIGKGNLGCIGLKSNKTEVKKVFGQPKHINRFMEGYGLEPIAWVYDNLYFGFDEQDKNVKTIGIVSHKEKIIEPSVGNFIKLISHGIKFGMQPEEIEKLLENYDLFYIEKLQWDYDGWEYKYSSGVCVYFQGDLNKQAPLFEISI